MQTKHTRGRKAAKNGKVLSDNTKFRVIFSGANQMQKKKLNL
jgi:hypothetical protein